MEHDIRELEGVVAALLDGEDAQQVHAILGDHSAGAIAEQWGMFVRRHLQTEVIGCTYDHVSVGITMELQLADGRACVLKACKEGPPSPREALRVQAHLAAQGFPAPVVLAFPESCAGAQVYLMEVLDRGDGVRYDASIRGTMAQQYARLVTLAETIEPKLSLVGRSLDPARLWPTPHSVLFDFEATQHSAAPIDALASAARAELRGFEVAPIAAHCDWSLQNVSFREGRIIGVFDWDSVSVVPEVVAVAGAAVFHLHDWRIGPEASMHDFYPGPEPALEFVEIYARQRGRSWTSAERARLHAAMVYALGYQARCQHSVAPDEQGPAHRRLLRFAEAFGFE